jgi:hypothetical protein
MKTDSSPRSRVAENAIRARAGDFPAERILLPMSTGISIPPNTSAKITSRPQNYGVRPDRLLIKHAERWRINRAETMRFPWLPAGPAVAFAPGEHTPLPERRVPCAGDVTLDVTYVGPCKEGESFEACLFVEPVSELNNAQEIQPPTSTGARPHAVPPNDRLIDRPRAKVSSDVRIQARAAKPVQDHTFRTTVQAREPFWPQRLAIADAAHWVVNDLRVDGVSLLAQDGDLPGILFSDAAQPVLPPIRIGMLSADDDGLEITATYVGPESSPVLTCELSGSTTAPDVEPYSGVSTFLPVSSGVRILPGTSAQISTRPCIPSDGNDGPWMAFRASQIVVADADDWVVTDIRIGNMSQFSQSGDVPGVAFSAVAAELVRLTTLQSCMDFTICVRYVGARDLGAPFLCGVAGNAFRAA